MSDTAEVDDVEEINCFTLREQLAETLVETLETLDRAAGVAESLQDYELLKQLDNLREIVDNLV